MSHEDRSGNVGGRIMSRYGVVTLGCLMIVIPTSGAMATCSYDLNGVGYGDNCPYRGPVNRPRAPVYYYHPPTYYPPRVFAPPQPVGPTPAQLQAQQRKRAGHNANENGVAAYRKHDWGAAIADLRRALRLWPENGVIRHNLQQALAAQSNVAGLADFRRGDYAAAVAAFRRAHTDLPGDGTIKLNLSSALDNWNRERQLADAKPKIAAILDTPAGTPAGSADPGAGLTFMGVSATPAVDPLAAAEPPVPDLASLHWDASFPSSAAPAAVIIAQTDLDEAAGAAAASRTWLGAKLIDAVNTKAKNAGIAQTIAALPLSNALKDEVQWQEGMVERYKDMFQDVSQDTNNYLLGYASVVSNAAACMGSASVSGCGAEQVNVQVLANRYANQSSDRWQSWISGDMKAHLTRFFGTKP